MFSKLGKEQRQQMLPPSKDIDWRALLSGVLTCHQETNGAVAFPLASGGPKTPSDASCQSRGITGQICVS